MAVEKPDERTIIHTFLNEAFDIIDDPRGDFPFDSISGRRVLSWLYELNEKRRTKGRGNA
jgi:hypothetical protein